MTTRAALYIQNAADERWLEIYVHCDGYPEHMATALDHADPAEILRAAEIRSIDEAGQVESFEQPRPAARIEAPQMPSWASHAYVLTAIGWAHAANAREMSAICEALA